MVRIFRHYISASLIALSASEALIFVLSVYLAVTLRPETGGLARHLNAEPLYPKALLFALVMIVTMTSTGLYQRGLRDSVWGTVFRIFLGFLLGGFLMVLIGVAFPSLDIGRDGLVVALVMALLGIALARSLFHTLVQHDPLKLRVLVLGTGKQAAQITQFRRKADWRGISLVGFVHTPGEHAVVDPNKALHIKTTLLDLVREHDIDELVIAVENRRRSFPIDELIECKMSGIAVTELLTFFERQFGKIRLDMLYPSSIILLDGFSHAVVRRFSKQSFDVLLALLMLIVTSPVFLITAIAILAESRVRGPILYRQERVGRNGRPFNVLKFRSMAPDAEKDGVAVWAMKNDSRVTRVGRFIRKTRIDELPQVLNVLKGEMSFVGPRPERPEFVDMLSEKVPYYTMRHRVNPGITGWAQIRYPYGGSESDAREKLEYDLYYIKNYSLFLDLIIIFQTVQVILWGHGAR